MSWRLFTIHHVSLVFRAQELVIDAIFRSNNSDKNFIKSRKRRYVNFIHLRISLFAVLVELDGTGIPFRYLPSYFNELDQASQTAVVCVTTCNLEQFLCPIKEAGYDPNFFWQ